ncbi:hypothetical protein [Alkalihalobacterium elongatum]|uniref:hypothetical protein n=1 Tax=Alkalihalobacterium elongatum TaxID=2675466 RepID=UPI001C1F2463|nr:hypothetical protein [Alkalihalobacterium elongatum]
MQNNKIPSKKRYIVALIAPIIGSLIFVAMLFLVFLDDSEDVRVIVPGMEELVLESGNYTIFHEYRSIVDGKIYHTDHNIQGLGVLIYDPSTDIPVPLQHSSGSTYSTNGIEGTSVFKFSIDEPGNYQLMAQYEGIDQGSEVVLNIKKSFVGKVIAFGGGIFVMVLSVLFSVFLFLHTFFKRSKLAKAS